jgi:septal ring factor EnvC (AmiA/AmiB activator)
MTPGQQSRRDTTEEMRRQQQVDEKIRELEQEIGRLRRALRTIRRDLNAISVRTKSPDTHEDAIQALSSIDRALNSGGDGDD